MSVKTYLLISFLLFNPHLAKSEAKPNIVLITIDTLRADHLGCYGYKSSTSPNLDLFAKQGVLFQNAFTAVPLTLPSHATMLTGLYPQHHGIRDNAHFPLTKSEMVQQTLKRYGYSTNAIVSGAPLASGFGLNRGFDSYHDEFPGAERKADATTNLALQEIKTFRPPYFLWVHYFDPHAEYEPPESFKNKFPNAPYDGEIAFVDSQISRLVEAVGQNAFVIIVADHGESLGEHQETTHAVFVYNATLHVPLLIRGSGLKPEIRKDPVSLTDITPTILQLAGAKSTSTTFDGVSLLTGVKDRTLLAESLYAERNFGYAPLFACIRQGKKFIEAPQPEFYDLINDEGELHNLIQQNKSGECQQVIRTYSKAPQVRNQNPLPEEEQEKLRSLGYVSATVAQTGADPKTKIQVIENFRKGMILLKEEKYNQAEKSFREISTTEQHNGLAFRFLGDALSAQQKYSDAVNAYSTSFERLPDPEVAVQLAKALNRIQKPEVAEKVLNDAMNRFPDYYEATFELASFYVAQKKWAEGLSILNRDLPEFHNQRGILFTQKGEPQKAIQELLTAIKGQSKASYWNNLAIAYQKLGQFKDAEEAFQKALSLNPDYEECQVNLSFLLIQLKRWDEALNKLTVVTSRNSKLLQARFALGFVLENQGKKQEALDNYQKLLQDVPVTWPQKAQLETRIRVLSQ
jgi:arylsulfatase A-like enzyme/Flp pilus assembly protein TadD